MSLPNISLLLYILTLSNLLLSIIFYIRSNIKNKWSLSSSTPDTNDAYTLLYEINKIMASTIILEELVEKLLSTLFLRLQVSEGALLLIAENKITWAKTVGYSSSPIFDEEILIKLVNNTNDMVIVDKMDEGETKDYLLKNNRKILIPLIVNEIKEGILVLGEKKTKKPYTSSDLSLLKVLSPEIAIVIQNAESYEETRRFNLSLQRDVEASMFEMKKVNEEIYKKNVELKHISDELASANEKLKELDKLKDEFVSLASHELRTPMTAIKSYLWLFLQSTDVQMADKQKTYLERAYQATDRLINLVNDMLNVSRIESGRMDILIKPCDLRKLTREVIEELSSSAENQKVSLVLDSKDEHLPSVLADQNKIREVLINLIGNSLKFTDAGGNITVSLINKDDVIITQIKDTGRGIKKEDLPKLFQKFGFVGANYLHKQNAQGTGLGLYISKSIVNMHGGKIWVESDGENKGTTFIFTLNVALDNKSIKSGTDNHDLPATQNTPLLPTTFN